MRLPLFGQFLASLLCLLTGVTWMAGWCSYQAAERAVSRQVEEQMQHIARTLQASSFPLTEAVLAQIQGLSGFDLLWQPHDGRQLSTTSAPDDFAGPAVAASWKQLRLDDTPRRLGQEIFLASGVTLAVTRRPAGQLFLFYSVTQRDGLAREAASAVLQSGAAGSGAAVFLAVVWSRWMGQRIRRVQLQTEAIAAGNFAPMPLPKWNDELRTLTAALNEMSCRLQDYQQQLAHDERLRVLHQISAGLVHHLRNAVTGARLAVQLYLREGGRDETPLTVALRQLDLLEERLRRFLTFGTPAAAKPAPCCLRTIVTEALTLLRPHCQHHRTELNALLDGGAIWVLGDRLQLEQAVLNVVANAVEAAGPRGCVEVRMTADLPEARARLEVDDSGAGLADGVAQRLGQPFTTTKKDGHGLGLAVTQRIIADHRGTLSWHRLLGTTRFILVLPLTTETREATCT